MKLASFDLEIAKPLPDGASDWKKYSPLGIACAAVALNDSSEPVFWHGVPQMTRTECQQMVRDCVDLVNMGYTFLTWNGCSFDFGVLAEESGMYDECAELAINHVDMMLMVTFTKGWYLSLQKALKGAGLEGKLTRVTISTGEVITDMDGAKAPRLWAAGEYDAVLAYLRYDVQQTLKLAYAVQRNKAIRWTSNSGRAQQVSFDRLLTVRESFRIPEPDTSWMTDPPSRMRFVEWMPESTTW
jgi:hypothetical protein